MSQLMGVTLSNDGGAAYAFMTDNSGQLTKAWLIYGGYINGFTGHRRTCARRCGSCPAVAFEDGDVG